MSSFICEKCGKEILDSPDGYTTFCEHYPIEREMIKREIDNLTRRCPIFRMIVRLAK